MAMVPVHIFLKCNPSFTNKARYVFSTLFARLHVERLIFYENPLPSTKVDDSKGIKIVYCDLNREEDYDTRNLYLHCSPQAMSFFPMKRELNGEEIHEESCEGVVGKVIWLFTKSGHAGNGHIPYDLIASAFFFLSRWEEHILQKKDRFNRFPFQETIFSKYDLYGYPIVNNYLSVLLHNIIQHFGIKLTFKRWQGKEFAICLTHDVDRVKAWYWKDYWNELYYCFSLAVQGKSISSSSVKLWNMATASPSQEEYWNFPHLIRAEEAYGFSSTFFFMAFRRTELDARYTITARRFKNLFSLLREKGWEIGLHGSTGAFASAEKLFEEKEILERVAGHVGGIRFHYLTLSLPGTFYAIQKAGFSYDTTLGFAEREGFRQGFAFPYFPYDIENDKPHRFVEIPLLIMDGTLVDQRYRHLGYDDAYEAIAQQIYLLKRLQGCGAILWHTGYTERNQKTLHRLYQNILRLIQEENGCGLSGEQTLSAYISGIPQGG